MSEPRIQSMLWVEALIARVSQGGASAFIIGVGDKERGDLMVKIATMDGNARILTRNTGIGGDSVFVDVTSQLSSENESEVDKYIAKAKERDCDLWVVEIEDKEGRHFLTETVE